MRDDTATTAVDGCARSRDQTHRQREHLPQRQTLWVAFGFAAFFTVLAIGPSTNAQAPPSTPPKFEDPRPLPNTPDALNNERTRAEDEARARHAAEQRAAGAEQRRRETEAALKKVQQEADRRTQEALQVQERQRQQAQDAARKATEQRREAEAAASSAAANPAPRAANCAPANITTKPLDAGRMEIIVTAPCHTGQNATLIYGPYQFINALDANGTARIVLDAFLPNTPTASLNLPGTKSQSLPVTSNSAGKISKVAIVWRGPMNLDLHALEYAARKGGPGHIWADAPSTPQAARRKAQATERARGFLTMLDRGAPTGHRAEVYTVTHAPKQHSGTITFSLDYQTRAETTGPDYCGEGPYASITIDVYITRFDGAASKERVQIPGIPCASITRSDTRYLRDAIPDLRFR